ncbi:MAG: AAA family ATPase [Deltaproteobacteria bacterium]|nr:AAA family ATPase [Deltaproteobacteria bacterium]MBW1921935.1 AAA family ATPase [Deltaproteobacteria bacterium]MBW1948797.1 AAA family ATPase [Deltaproteobacteria bacterium]MBW2006474.1 AAA family ATPase [Deltaproteobacteria bacterium]MBW2101170.1 AAA family ATPase [Deltaproteobacteria bacterium]
MSKLKKALEKAKETRRMDQAGAGLPGQEDREAQRVESGQKAATPPGPDRHEINPVYQRTKVIQVDPSTLRKNKIVSLFPDNRMTDQIKILRTQILKRMKELSGNSLLVTSPGPGEGKTLTAVNLAVSISLELDRTVLLVDADLRTPSIHRYFGFKEDGGLSDHLVGGADIADLMVNPGIEKLTILPAGKALPNSSEHLGAPRMESLVKEMKERYSERFIIFDCSSLLTSADPISFSRFVDGVLLVVEAEKCTRKDLTRALELLRDRPLVGTVFNKARD